MSFPLDDDEQWNSGCKHAAVLIQTQRHTACCQEVFWFSADNKSCPIIVDEVVIVDIVLFPKVDILSCRFEGSQCYTQSTYEIKELEASFVTPHKNLSSYNDGMFTLIHIHSSLLTENTAVTVNVRLEFNYKSQNSDVSVVKLFTGYNDELGDVYSETGDLALEHPPPSALHQSMVL